LNIEESFFFSQFLKLYGQNNLLLNHKKYNLKIDLPYFYQFNSSIKNIESSDLIFLIAINPRFEASNLNLRIRKHYIKRNISINLIGSFIDLTYPINHLGSSIKTLLNITEGKNSFCKKIRKSLNPMFIIGSEIGLRIDYKTIQKLLMFLNKKSFLLLKNNFNLNYVHSNIAQSNYCELGLNSNSKSKIYLINKKKLFNIHFIENNTNDYKFKDKKKDFFLSLNTHQLSNEHSFKYLVPINSFYERAGLNINIEGIIQKSYKIITPFHESRNSEDVFRAIFFSNKINDKKFRYNLRKKYLTNKWLYKENPFLKKTNTLRKKFIFNFLNITEISSKIFITNFKPLLNNFYMTDNISKNSKIMAECTLFLNNFSNFYKTI